MQHFNSRQYWEERYNKNKTSGSGSYGRLAEFKAEIMNNFVLKEKIKSVVELGCGDGNQLLQYKIPLYQGFDISDTVIKKCKEKFYKDSSKTFNHIRDLNKQKYELAMSIDVIFHLIEDEVYETYMTNLFQASKKFVIIYSSNKENKNNKDIHVRHRVFTNWISKNKPQWKLHDHIPNKFPTKINSSKNNSFCDFFIFKLES